MFLEMQGKDDLSQLNRLNLKLQGKERNVSHLMDCLRGVLTKLAWNVAKFENVSAVVDENEDSLLDPLLKTEITQHLRSLQSELNMQFPEFKEEEGNLVRNCLAFLI